MEPGKQVPLVDQTRLERKQAEEKVAGYVYASRHDGDSRPGADVEKER